MKNNNDSLENVVRSGFADVKKLLSDMKGELATVKQDVRDTKVVAEKNTVDGRKRDERLDKLEAKVDKLITGDQDVRRRNGRRLVSLCFYTVALL